MPLTDNQKNALQYVAAALNEYGNTLAPTVRGPFVREAQAALKEIEEGLTLTPAEKP
jgi:hypothetical protein